MKLFDIFKKKAGEQKEEFTNNPGRLQNFPEMLVVKLLFIDKPNLNVDDISKELGQYFDIFNTNKVDDKKPNNALIFTFPDVKVELADVTIPAQCIVAIPDDKFPLLEIPEVAFQQNWHWAEANDITKKCRYELMVTDLMTRTLEYKQRLNLYTRFLTAVAKATNPDVVYSVYGQKLVNPAQIIENVDSKEPELLHSIFNVRLYNITDTGNRDLLMDTVGLHSIGLPDFQIRFSNFETNVIANLLWNYAYYIFENGDIIENGNTLEGIESGSRWKCERIISPLHPERMVINVQPN